MSHTHDGSLLLAMPPEIRMMIYQHLLDEGSDRSIVIRNMPQGWVEAQKKSVRQSNYHVLERSFMRRSYKTTYGLAGGSHRLHPAIVGVNRRIRNEASAYLYGRHTFHFGDDLEAVVPFFADKTTSTLHLVRSVTLNKSVPSSPMDADSSNWTAICGLLRALPNLNRLRLLMNGGRPCYAWRGPQEMSVSNLQFLYDTRHEIIEWVRELAGLHALEQVEIRACLQPITTEPQTHSALVYAAFSASLETTLVEFLSTHLHIPAVAGH